MGSRKQRATILLMFFAAFFVYFFTSPGETAYNYFSRLAESFSNGKLYLEESAPHLNELIPIENGKYYVPYAPMPGILLTPLALFQDKQISQTTASHLLGAGIGVLTFANAFLISKSRRVAVYLWLLSSFGTNLWFLASVGSSWYFGQLTACFFLSLAIFFHLRKSHPLLSGLALGAAYLARPHIVLALPFLMIGSSFYSLIYLGMGILPFLGFNFYYNYARFGVIWDKGYSLIPGVLDEVWYQKGIFHYSYIPRHIKTILSGLPKFTDKFPYLLPKMEGMSPFLVSPAFILAFWAPTKKMITKISYLAIFLVSLPILMHGTVGFSQFGYRFAVDFYPLLFLLIALGIKEKISRLDRFLLFLSIAINFWGVMMINKLELFA